MKSALFVQARMGSQRLPGKALLPLGEAEWGLNLTLAVLKALSSLSCSVKAVLTDESSREALAPLAESEGFSLFCGPEEDVLARFTQAAAHYQPDYFIRATGDNPLVSAEIAGLTEQLFHETRADYAGLLGMPLGTGVEVIRTSALAEAARSTVNPYDREHVAPYLYKNPKQFRISQTVVSLPELRCDTKVTLDTPEDYRYIDFLYRQLYRGKPIEIRELIPWLKTHPRSIS